LEILFGIVLTKFIAYFDEEISDFRFVVDVFLERKLKLIFENLNWSANESKTLSFVALENEG
jgi:hypothetical protein